MSISNMPSVELAYQEWQRQAIPHIVTLAASGGAGIDRKTPDWRFGGIRKGGLHWYNSRERDIVWFPEQPPIGEYKRQAGPVRTSDLEPVIAIVESIGNETDRDQPEAFIEYERGTTISRRSVDQGTLGISITAYVEAQAGGGESTGGSYAKVGSSTTLSAEYLHALEKGKDDSDVVTLHIGAIPKANALTVIEQVVQKGIATVKIKERMIIDPCFHVIDYKKLSSSGWLNGNRDYSNWNGKSRILWKVDDIGELKVQLEGRHPEYPGARGKNLLRRDYVRRAYEWLADEDNRTFESETTVKFDTAQQGDASIRYDSLLKV